MNCKFKKTHKGFIGEAWEMTLKTATNRPNADKVSGQGKADFRWKNAYYEVKQNGGCIQYNPNARYISGSSRVIYATHVAYDVIAEDDEYITISVDVRNTEFFVLDRNKFVEFLLTHKGATKYNKARNQVNIQTVFNYTKNAYHGKLGKAIEAWAYENALDDPIIDVILTNA